MDQWAGHPLSPTPMQSHSAPFWMEQGRGDAGPGGCPGQPGPASSRLTPLALRGVSLSFTLSLAPATRNLLQIRGLALRSHPCLTWRQTPIPRRPSPSGLQCGRPACFQQNQQVSPWRHSHLLEGMPQVPLRSAARSHPDGRFVKERQTGWWQKAQTAVTL